MFDFKKNTLLLPSILLFLAAVIFAWAVVTLRAPQQAGFAPIAPQVQAQTRPQLPAGTPNPADSLPRRVATATGKITAVGANTVTIQAGAPGGQAASSSVTFQINAQTMIYKRGAAKDTAAYQKEMQDFLAKLAYADPNSAVIYLAPDPYEHAALKLADLQKGTVVTITPSTADLKTAATIFASQM